MTSQLKADIKTIIEVSTYLLLLLAISSVSNGYLAACLVSINIASFFYYRFFRKGKASVFNFPTQNDSSSQMFPISLGVLLVFGSVIGFFALDLNLYGCHIVAINGVISCFIGFNGKPDGWISIEDTTMRIWGINEPFDIRQLKEIDLRNDKITLTNIYGESKYSFGLNLDHEYAEKLKQFLEEKLNKVNVFVVSSVTDAEQQGGEYSKLPQ